jgi:hypothetical protein
VVWLHDEHELVMCDDLAPQPGRDRGRLDETDISRVGPDVLGHDTAVGRGQSYVGQLLTAGARGRAEGDQPAWQEVLGDGEARRDP